MSRSSIPAGAAFTSRSDLPSPNARRWTPAMRRSVIAAIDAAVIAEDEACHLYALARDDIAAWRTAQADPAFGEGRRAPHSGA